MNAQFDEKIERIKKGVQQYVNCDKVLFVFAKGSVESVLNHGFIGVRLLAR